MYIGVDLGTTNVKAALYDQDMKLVDRMSSPARYTREGGRVTFDAEEYYCILKDLLKKILSVHQITKVNEIAFTGQAETLVCLDKDDSLLLPAISWMDERSQEECAALSEMFTKDEYERITGQQAVLPTWPATKILWIRNNLPDVYRNVGTYMLLKDYVIFRLTGVKRSDMSIATFSFWFDIYDKCYWKGMLDAIGVKEEQLPGLVEPCSCIGLLLPAVSDELGLAEGTKINCGTLDHFAGMIGTGNTCVGGVTLSTGTVMAMSAMCREPVARDSGTAMHYGFIPDTHIMLPVVESGGASLEWFRNTCMGNIDYGTINRVLAERGNNDLLFLPYIVGTNAPEFDPDATGVFWGLRQEHDAFDMARAVMEGVSFVLRKNTEGIIRSGTELKSIIATGGGAKSDIWCQMQADATGLKVMVPAEKEAACLGAAIIAAVDDGLFASYEEAADKCISFERVFEPAPTEETEKKYGLFCRLYDAVIKTVRENTGNF